MGKYMKKSKVRGDVAVVVEGVRTRAKTLALRRVNFFDDVVVDESSFCYLQLRSRRLEKSLPPPPPPPPPPSSKEKTRCRAAAASTDNKGQNQDMGGSESLKLELQSDSAASGEVGLEVSFGDNIFDFESRDRSTRESTPCNLIMRDYDSSGAPGSTTKRSSSTATNRGVWSDVQRLMPTAQEIEDFFAEIEKEQQRLFVEKYNFDVSNDRPLPGCYEWVQVAP